MAFIDLSDKGRHRVHLRQDRMSLSSGRKSPLGVDLRPLDLLNFASHESDCPITIRNKGLCEITKEN